MLREDTHPPAYYGLLWLWGHLIGQSPVSLRFLSWLASSGPPPAMERKLKPLQSRVEQEGYRCETQATDLTHARLLHCRSEAMGPSE